MKKIFKTISNKTTFNCLYAIITIFMLALEIFSFDKIDIYDNAFNIITIVALIFFWFLANRLTDNEDE